MLLNQNKTSHEMLHSVKDWRMALRSAPSYRVGNRTIYIQKRMTFIILCCVLLISLLYFSAERTSCLPQQSFYNQTYPLSAPIVSDFMRTYRIGLISDLDKDSKAKEQPNTWIAYFRKGYLTYNDNDQSVVISWDKTNDVVLTTSFASAGRGMELSELVVFNGRLLSFDDRSGIVYEIANDRAVPWILLMDGDGTVSKGFKSEWATVKGEELYIGSMGKEYTSASGAFESHNPQYVKIVSTKGEVKHLSWINQFEAIRSIMGITFPGYLIHESGVWSDIHKKWFFLPRRCSHDPYNETMDEVMGCNVLIIADEYFKSVHMVKIGEISPKQGYSSFKFIPSTNDNVIVALKTEEYMGQTKTYIEAFTIKGDVILPLTLISNTIKFEGLEFI